MSNIPYCRFQNTLSDLQDCYEAMCEVADYDKMGLSEREMEAMKRLIRLCKQIAEEN